MAQFFTGFWSEAVLRSLPCGLFIKADFIRLSTWKDKRERVQIKWKEDTMFCNLIKEVISITFAVFIFFKTNYCSEPGHSKWVDYTWAWIPGMEILGAILEICLPQNPWGLWASLSLAIYLCLYLSLSHLSINLYLIYLSISIYLSPHLPARLWAISSA